MRTPIATTRSPAFRGRSKAFGALRWGQAAAGMWDENSRTLARSGVCPVAAFCRRTTCAGAARTAGKPPDGTLWHVGSAGRHSGPCISKSVQKFESPQPCRPAPIGRQAVVPARRGARHEELDGGRKGSARTQRQELPAEVRAVPDGLHRTLLHLRLLYCSVNVPRDGVRRERPACPAMGQPAGFTLKMPPRRRLRAGSCPRWSTGHATGSGVQGRLGTSA